MPHTSSEDKYVGLFPHEDLSAPNTAPDWKADFLATQKSRSAALDENPKAAQSTPLAAQWPDENGAQAPEAKPLKLRKCTRSECEKGLHCFILTKKQAQQKKAGECRSCDAQPIDFGRVKKRDLADVEHTLASLQQEWIRFEYWTQEIDIRAIRHAKRKGMTALLAEVPQRLEKAIGKPLSQNVFDGRQTSWEGNPFHYAQHATATCCRKCLELWHGIPLESEISPEQLNYFSVLVQRYLQERLKDKDVRPHPTKAAPFKKPDSATLSLDFGRDEADGETR